MLIPPGFRGNNREETFPKAVKLVIHFGTSGETIVMGLQLASQIRLQLRPQIRSQSRLCRPAFSRLFKDTWRALPLSVILISAAQAEPPADTTPVKFFSGGAYDPGAAERRDLGLSSPSESKAARSYRLNEEGVELVFKGRKVDGQKKIEQALEQDPQNATALYNLAGLELAGSRPKDSIALMERALAIKPNDPAFLNRLAESHFANSDVPRAIESYEQIVALDPGFGEAMSRLGTLYGMVRSWEKAEATLRRAVEVHPKDSEALANLGNVLVLREKFDEAVTILKRAQSIKKAPENSVALGIAYEALKRKDDAIAQYREAKELGDKDPELDRHLQELTDGSVPVAAGKAAEAGSAVGSAAPSAAEAK